MLGVAAEFGAVTIWQLAALLLGVVPGAVPLSLYRRLRLKIDRLRTAKLLTIAIDSTTSRLLRPAERAEYRATAYGASRATSHRGRRRNLLAALDETNWVESGELTAAFCADIADEHARRGKLQQMVVEGLLDVRHQYNDGRIEVVFPTAAGHRLLGLGLPIPPKRVAIRHHLLTVESAIGILHERAAQRVASPEVPSEFHSYLWDEPLRSRAQKGAFVRRGMRYDSLPDAELWLKSATSDVTECIPLEFLTSDYSEKTRQSKVKKLPPSTQFFVETPAMVAAIERQTKQRPRLLRDLTQPAPDTLLSADG